MANKESEKLQQPTENEPKVVILKNNDPFPDDFTDEVAIVRIWTSTANPDIPGEYVGHVSLELILNEERGSWSKRTYISVGPDTNDYDLVMKRPFHQFPVSYVENYAEDINSEGRPPECTFVFYSLDVVAMKVAVDKFLEAYPLDNQRWTTAGPSFSLGEATMGYGEIISDMFQWYTIRGTFSNRKCLKNATEGEKNFPTENSDSNNEGAIKNVSCVSLVFEILNKGCLSTKLLANEAAKKSFIALSDESSNQSRQAVLHLEYLRILRAAGYVLEYGLGSFILSPDVFVDLMKAAKRKELKEKGRPNFLLQFVNHTQKSDQPFEATEEIPSLEEKKKKPYHFMAFSAVTVIAIAILIMVKLSG